MILLLVLLVLVSMLFGFIGCSMFIFDMYDLPEVYLMVFCAVGIVFLVYVLR